jgi:hypothetical protein
MNQAIIVGSYRGSPHLERCLNSIPQNIPTIVFRTGGYECGAIRGAIETTNLTRFLFLQDSTEVVDPCWIYENWESGESISLNAEPWLYGSYLGWWNADILRKIGVPATPTKIDAVLLETRLAESYVAKLDAPPRVLWPHFTVQFATPQVMFSGTHHERKVMVYDNGLLRKFKSAFNGDTAHQAQERDEKNRQLYP